MNGKIAIQGIKGSFHHQVAEEYFGAGVEVSEFMSFREEVASLVRGDSQLAVMAIENSIVGSILPNYALIDENQLKIIGEHFIPIHLNLMALPGQALSDIRKVHSHPMALLQCKDFFASYPGIKLIEDTDTAEVARRIKEKGARGVAAVASRRAAALYELEILAAGIHTIKSNSTRFLILDAGNKGEQPEIENKASVKFELESKRGSLVTILNIIRDYELDMTKIQSVPVIETPWKYAFFIDVLFDDIKKFNRAIEILTVMTEQLKVLGTYKNKMK